MLKHFVLSMYSSEVKFKHQDNLFEESLFNSNKQAALAHAIIVKTMYTWPMLLYSCSYTVSHVCSYFTPPCVLHDDPEGIINCVPNTLGHY